MRRVDSTGPNPRALVGVGGLMLWMLLLSCWSPSSEASDPGSEDARTRPSTPPVASAPDPRRPSDDGTLRARAAALDLPWPPPDLSLHVDKSDRRLTVHAGAVPIKRYRIGLSARPSGDKVQQGDLRTPVGRFTVVTRNPQSSYHLFLGLSYPDAADAERGLRDGLIGPTQAEAIRSADASDTLPPWNTALGGAIGIHGSGGWTDWTLGCIAVDDAEIEELWEVVPHRTVVVIEE